MEQKELLFNLTNLKKDFEVSVDHNNVHAFNVTFKENDNDVNVWVVGKPQNENFIKLTDFIGNSASAPVDVESLSAIQTRLENILLNNKYLTKQFSEEEQNELRLPPIVNCFNFSFLRHIDSLS